MQNRRVVLLSNHSLLTASIKSLLQSEANLELSTVTADDPDINTKIGQSNPHAIIMDSGDTALSEGAITRLLKEHPKTRVIVVNLNEHGIKMYQTQEILRTDLAGLLDAILSDRDTIRPSREPETARVSSERR